MFTLVMAKTNKCCEENLHEWRTQKRKGDTVYQKCAHCKSKRIQRPVIDNNSFIDFDFLDNKRSLNRRRR